MISIQMLKSCSDSVLQPLERFFKFCFESDAFSSEWKKANVFLVHKNCVKQSLKNYCLISLLPICGKVFRRLIYNKMFEYLFGYHLIYQNQSVFKEGDSSINQLLSITDEIYKSFD